MSDPISVIIRRKKAAMWARDIIYGHEARPVPEGIRTAWAILAAHYCGTGRMRYGEFIAVAEGMAGRGYREQYVGVRKFFPDLDDALRQEFSAALRRRADEIKVMEPGARQAEFAAHLEQGRRKDWTRDAVAQGRCPLCGSKTPGKCDCGIPALRQDGKGYVEPAPSHPFAAAAGVEL